MSYQPGTRFLSGFLGFTVLTIGLLLISRQSRAQGVGDLLIAPTRIVFEGSKRTAEINLINTGDKPATYRISLIHQRMNEEGKLDEIQTAAADEKFADDLVRFTPRQVLLEPHVSQLVRVQLRLPAELETGEYRSHLLFRAVPVPGAVADAASAKAPQGLSIRITPIYGVSIPVIVRHGKTSASAALANLKLEATPDGIPVLTGRISRTGNSSLYGDVRVTFTPSGSKPVPIGRISGVAVYTPNSGRNFAIRLTPAAGLELHNGMLRVFYRLPSSEGETMLAEATLALP